MFFSLSGNRKEKNQKERLPTVFTGLRLFGFLSVRDKTALRALCGVSHNDKIQKSFYALPTMSDLFDVFEKKRGKFC